MPVTRIRSAFAAVFYQRCFYLFVTLLVMVSVAPLRDRSLAGNIVVNLANVLFILSVIATVGRSARSFLVAFCLGILYVWLHWQAQNDADTRAHLFSLICGTVLYLMVLGYLLSYVFRRDVMTADKLSGAAATYMLIGVLWAYGYALTEHVAPQSFLIFGQPGSLTAPADLLYFSFTTLTSTGYGDIAPLSRPARALCVIEQVIGTLFVAILIARLAGVYPPRTGREIERG
jgi:hypothetical protein